MIKDQELMPTPRTTPDPPVLVVDDDEAILDIVRDTLVLENIPVVTAQDGVAALQEVETGPVSLVLLDMRMPGMDGWQFARTARERGLNLRIVVMTAAQDANKWARDIGAVDFLEKPFDLARLIAVVERSRKEVQG